MLGILEKVVWGLSLAAVVLFGVAFWIMGVPSSVPRLALQAKEVTPKEFRAHQSDEQNQQLEAARERSRVAREKRTGGKKPSPKASLPKETTYEVKPAILEHVNNKTKALQELKRARSKQTSDGGLQIYDFDEGSLFQVIGFEPDDVIYGVFFEGSPEVDLMTGDGALELYEAGLEQLEAGAPIVVDIKRRGKSEQIVFRLAKQ